MSAALEVTEDRRTLKSLQLDPTSGCKQRNIVRIRQAESSLGFFFPVATLYVSRWLITMLLGQEFWKETLLLSFPPELHKLLNRLAEDGCGWVTTGKMNK